MHEGYALTRILCDRDGSPTDYRIRDVNDAFTDLTGIPAALAEGLSIREIGLGPQERWLLAGDLTIANERYAVFEVHDESRGRVLKIHAFRPAPDAMGFLFSDITEVRRNAKLFRTAVEQFPGVFNIYDSERRLQFVNSEALRVSGMSEDELLGRRDEEVLPKEIYNQYLPVLERVYRTRKPERLETRHPEEYGGTVQIVHYVPVLTANGEIDSVIGITIDITERERQAEALTAVAAQERIRAAELDVVMETVPAVVFLSRDPECRHMVGSRAAHMILSVAPGGELSISAPDETQPASFRRMKDGVEIPPEALPMQRAASTGIPVVDYEFDVVYPDGSSRTLFGNAHPLKDPDGETYGAVSAFIDISRRKEAEELAQRRLKEIESIYRHAPVGLCVLDRDLRYLRINDRLAEINGIPAEAHIGRTLREVLPDVAESAEPGLRSVLQSGEAIHDVEITGTTPARPGVERTWLESWHPLRNSADAVVGVSIVAREITEEKANREKLENLTATLEDRVAERTELAESRADQLRALALELFEAEERERKRLSDLLHEDLQQLLAGARMQLQAARRHAPHPSLDIVEQLLEESMLKSRRLSHELSPTVLRHSEIASALRWLADQMDDQFGLSVALTVDDDGIEADESLKVFLFRAVQELLFNVVKHAETTNARVTMHRDGEAVVTTVSDDGRGFDTRTVDGSIGNGGLGIVSLRERASAIGGTLDVASTPGRGSRFTLRVPLRVARSRREHGDPTEPRESEAALDAPARSTTTTRVLFADDHKVIRQALISMISSQPDIEVVGEASNGREAISLADNLLPDVIVMDVSMPEVDGVEATRVIKSRRPGVRIIGLSMHDDEHTKRMMKSAGAEAFMNKAESSASLLRAIYGL